MLVTAWAWKFLTMVSEEEKQIDQLQQESEWTLI